MKRTTLIAALGLLVLAMLAVIAFAAQQPGGETSQPAGMMQGGGMMHGRGMGMKEMCPMHGGMMGCGMGQSAMVVSGKNIYMLAGHRILKYDLDLNLVAEAEVKMDMAKMQGRMRQMTEQCPMQQEMMQQGQQQ
jgi:hypothetical protein